MEGVGKSHDYCRGGRVAELSGRAAVMVSGSRMA